MRTDIESDLRRTGTDRHPQAIVHSKQHVRAGHRFTLIFVPHGSGAAVLSSCGLGCCRVVSVVVYSGLGVETRGLFGMATEQMAQMFGQLQQLSQQFVNQQQMFQQSLEMQRQQSQAQMDTLTNLGTAQVAKTTYDARDFHRVFSKMKGFKGDEKVWPDWRYKFRVEASRCFRQAAAILDWAEDRYDQPIAELDIQQVAARENWVVMANFNMLLHGDGVSH